MLTKTELKQLEGLVAKAQGVIGKEKEQEWPKYGGTVFCLESTGEIEEVVYTHSLVCFLHQGNVFRTKEAAERERDRRALLTKLLRESTFVPDWSDDNQYKYYPVYNHQDKNWFVSSMIWII